MERIRNRLKQELESLLGLLPQIHEGQLRGDRERILSVLAQCRQAAETVWEHTERYWEGDGIREALRAYREELAQTAEDWEHAEGHRERLDQLAEFAARQVGELRGYSEIVFMPYKASMWDSLESIYLAASKDPDCRCLVVPIPYCERDGEGKAVRWQYEGDLFPKGIPITSYQEYSLARQRPEAVFVHNPYDGYNRVTSVHPDYYSQRLKEYAGLLVYVPYYVTAGFFSESHRNFSVYRNMDYMIAQSEYFKEEARGQFYYDRLLPLGSPKLDRVIRICREKREIPAQWRPILEGKMAVMLNTSLNQVLFDGAAYLNKLRWVFGCLRERKDTALIWRPHPLLNTTLRSMRPELAAGYEALEREMLEGGWGILDQSPDLAETIRLSDAYIGESCSSVVNLFGAAGRPIFILDNYITGAFEEGWKRRPAAGALEWAGGSWWILGRQGLFRLGEDLGQAEYAGRIPDSPLWSDGCLGMTEREGRLYLAPYFARRMPVFQPETMEFSFLEQRKGAKGFRFRRVVAWKDRLFYLPQDAPAILEYRLGTGEWISHSRQLQEWRAGYERDRYENVYEGVVCGGALWMSASYSSSLLRLDLESGESAFCRIPAKGAGFSGLAADGTSVWAAEVHSGNLVRIHTETMEMEMYAAPEGFGTWASAYGRRLAYTALLDMGRWVIAAPGFSDSMVKFDKETGRASLLAADQWKPPKEPVNGYSPTVFFASTALKRAGENRIYTVRTWDRAILEIDLETEETRTHYPEMTEESLRRLCMGQDGFEKEDTAAEFSRKESAFFTLEGFLEDLSKGRLAGLHERQQRELRTLASNLDGTCGEKVYGFIKEKLEC